MDFYRNPNAPTAGLLVRDAGLLILRVTAGIVLGAFHAWQEGLVGWRHLWHKQAWPFVETIRSWGLPIPVVLASAATIIFGLCSIGLVLGVVSRLCAFLLLFCGIVGLAFNFLEPEAEKLYLYCSIYLVICLCGPGCFSMDHLLSGRRS